MRDGKNGYAPSPGIRKRWKRFAREAARKGITTVQDVFVTSGVSETVDICLTALLNPGDNLLTPSPDYPLYSAVLAKLGIELNAYDLNEEDGWQPDLIDLQQENQAAHPRNRADQPQQSHRVGLLARMLEADRGTGAAEQSRNFRRRNLRQADPGDDAHTRNRRGRARRSGRDFRRAIEELSRSRMADRLGHRQRRRQRRKTYVEGIHRLLRARLCANHPEQYAIKAALDGPQDHLKEDAHKLRARRDLTMKWCNSTPRVSCVSPRGAFYAFPRIDIPEGDDVFVKELFRQKHVLVVHGSGFGQKPGTKHFRIVFLPDEPTLTKAYQSIGEFMAERYK